MKQYSFFAPKSPNLIQLSRCRDRQMVDFSAPSAKYAACLVFSGWFHGILVVFSCVSLGFLLNFCCVSRRFLAGLSWVFGVFCGFSRIVSRETFKKGAKSCLKTTKTAHKRAFSLVFVVFSSSQQRNAVLAPGDQKHYRDNTKGNRKGEAQRKRKRKQNEEAQREV